MTPYATTTDATTYFTARGQSAEWSAVADPAAALYRASQYVDLRYRKQLGTGVWRSMFSGTKAAGRAQDQEWPRVGATDYAGNPIDSATVPIEVVNATMEAALREGTNPGSLMPDYDPSEDRLPTSEQIGNLKVSYGQQMTYRNVTNDAPGQIAVSPTLPVFPEIDAIIAPVLTGVGGVVAMNVIR